mmetsp:Transcript_12509/g.17357  ORF Transcript_12509/g.17357 Transcript_12509/m.17357 type:complete len:261 (-) Transcript_12509:938-1720(-)
MCRPIGTHRSSAIKCEANRQVLERDIMNNLVVSSLQERRVDGAHGLDAFDRQARGKCYCMLFGDTHVEASFGELLSKAVKPRSAAHCRVDTHYLRVLLGLGNQRVGEIVGVRVRNSFFLILTTSGNIESANAVHLIRCGLSRGITFTLFGNHVNHNGSSCLCVLHFLQNSHQVIEIVTVYRADVIKTEFLKERRRSTRNNPTCVFIDSSCNIRKCSWKLLGDPFCNLSKLSERLVCLKPRKSARESADRGLISAIVLGRE